MSPSGLFHDYSRKRPGGVDCRLGGVDRAHDVGPGGGVQPESPGDPGDLSSGEHEAKPQQGMVLEHHESRHQNGGLEEGRQAQADDLLDPLDKSVDVSSWNREHIEAPHGDLDQQDTAPLQVGEEHLDDRIGHEDDTEQDHDGAGDDPQAEIAFVDHVRQGVDFTEVCYDLLPQFSDSGACASQAHRKGPLEGYRQGIQPDGHRGEQGHRKEALDDVQGCLLQVGSSAGILNAALEGPHHQAYSEQRPRQPAEKQDNHLDPFQIE